MTKPFKQKMILLLGIMALMLLLLAISLPSLQMQPGEIFSLQISTQFTASNQEPMGIAWFFGALRGFLVLLIILLPVHIVISLFSKEGRQRLLFDILRIALIFLAVFWLSNKGLPFRRPGESMGQQPGFAGAPEFPIDLATPPTFEANPQPWMLTLIMIGAAVLFAVIAFFVMRLVSKRKSAKKPQFQDFAENAQAALEAIESAQINFNDVIIRCYAEMSQTLRAESGIQRAEAMTTHEFEQDLLSKGFPAQPVQQLTKLFEKVRYGRQIPGEKDKRIATESLTEIIAFCKVPG